MVTYKLMNVGRRKWCGEVRAQTDEPGHVEMALLRAAGPHLMSQDIDFNGDNEKGDITVGGCRVVGTYERVRLKP